MKKIVIILILLTVFILPKRVIALDNLSITYNGQAISGPVFDVHNMMPGDTESREIVITNKTQQIQTIILRVIRTGPDGQNDPKIETMIDFSVWENNLQFINTQKLLQYFNQGDINLGIFYPNVPRTFLFKANLPLTTPNIFQKKQVIFNLFFGILEKDNLVINEVYYQVDANHGNDSLFDREISHFDNWFVWEYKPGCDFDNFDKLSTCPLTKIDRKTACGSPDPKYRPQFTDYILNFWYRDNNWCGCDFKLKNNDEWVELYNPTDHEIKLNNWQLIDNSGLPTFLKTNKSIPSLGFILISRNKDTWNYWPNKNAQAVVIETGTIIGNGLGNKGDRLLLKNPIGQIVDRVGWGNDKLVWNPAVTSITLGSSISRIPNGLDTDKVIDWQSQNPPTPGY